MRDEGPAAHQVHRHEGERGGVRGAGVVRAPGGHDWSAKVTPIPYAFLGDPQSLNLYAYVRNNPLTRVDLDGHDGNCVKGSWCEALKNAWNQIHQIAVQASQAVLGTTAPGSAASAPAPRCAACPHGLGIQLGVEAAAGLEAGGHGAGAAVTGSVSAGVFAGGDQGVNGGVFGTYGVHATGTTNGGDPPQTNSAVVPDKPLVAGAGANGGPSVFLTNATSRGDMNGLFSTTSVAAALGIGFGVQISVGKSDAGNAIWMVSGGLAGGLAAYEHSIVTNTVPIYPQ